MFLNAIVALGGALFSLVSEPAASRFQSEMQASVLASNFELRSYSYEFETRAGFDALTSRAEELSRFVASRVQELCIQKRYSMFACAEGTAELTRESPHVYEGDGAASVFANWIYAVDGENWYEFAPMSSFVSAYVNHANRKLWVWPSFRPDEVLVSDFSTNGLPVVANSELLTVTIWTLNLKD
jgi:hypothetical protein